MSHARKLGQAVRYPLTKQPWKEVSW